MLMLSGFELYPRWVPLLRGGLLDIVCPAALKHEIWNPEKKLWKRKRKKERGKL